MMTMQPNGPMPPDQPQVRPVEESVSEIKESLKAKSTRVAHRHYRWGPPTPSWSTVRSEVTDVAKGLVLGGWMHLDG